MLRGHNGAITALHCVTRREVWDLVGDREDAGFFISGSTDCLVREHIFLIMSTLIIVCLVFGELGCRVKLFFRFHLNATLY